MPREMHDLPPAVLEALQSGTAIPAHPLALVQERKLDLRRQRALTRYYCDAGAGGLAVGVHTTQFAIRDVGLYEPVLRLAAEEAGSWCDRPLVMIAGLAGNTGHACREADIATGLGYHAGLLSLGGLRDATEDELIDHCRAVAERIPVVGFYLQPAVGGRHLGPGFWRRFAEIENVVAIKMAPFNRYRTLDVAFGIVDAQAEERVTLYTGNDDHIVLDLLTPMAIRSRGREVTMRFRGGLLGHWSVWTQAAAALLKRLQAAVAAGGAVPPELLALDAMVTDCNAVLFDFANDFRGCIPGCHEVLRRQGLLRTINCLDPHETLSPGQAEEIDRLYAAYPDLTDDAFVAANRERWLA